MRAPSRRLLVAAIAQLQDLITQLEEAGVQDLDEPRARLRVLWDRVGDVSPSERVEIERDVRDRLVARRKARQLSGADWELRLLRPAPRRAPTGATTATLFMNDDFSRCGACGRNADPREDAHLNQRVAEVTGCGARFVAVSSDLTLTPRLRRLLAARRPDLPLADDQVH